MKLVITLFAGSISTLLLASCGDTVYNTYPQSHHYHSNTPSKPSSSPKLSPAPSGGHSIDAVGQPDSFSGQ